MIHKKSLVEAIADYAIEQDCDVDTAIDSVTEGFMEVIMMANADELDLTYGEADALSDAIAGAIESFADEAQQLVDENNEKAREEYYEREEARRGQY